MRSKERRVRGEFIITLEFVTQAMPAVNPALYAFLLVEHRCIFWRHGSPLVTMKHPA